MRAAKNRMLTRRPISARAPTSVLAEKRARYSGHAWDRALPRARRVRPAIRAWPETLARRRPMSAPKSVPAEKRARYSGHAWDRALPRARRLRLVGRAW